MTERWTQEQAWAWHEERPWLSGFNYMPSYAVNSTEFWQEETFNADVIARELGWAGDIGFNACRVFLPYIVWEADPAGFTARLEQFLAVAARCGLSVMPILFDDCAFAGREPYLGPQADPLPGVHNSGWTPSPGRTRVVDQACWPRLEEYARQVVGAFVGDPRILAWDLYNEPGNGGMGDETLPLLRTCFDWARAARPSQPLTVALWTPALPNLNAVMLAHSDVISFHDYNPLPATREQVAALRQSERPLLCTEWMRRGFGSHFDTHFVYWKAEGIGSFFWGLVNGRTQTHYPWESKPNGPEPSVWFHDLLRADGTAYDMREVEFLRICLKQ